MDRDFLLPSIKTQFLFLASFLFFFRDQCFDQYQRRGFALRALDLSDEMHDLFDIAFVLWNIRQQARDTIGLLSGKFERTRDGFDGLRSGHSLPIEKFVDHRPIKFR